MKLSFATILPLLSLTLSPAIAVPNLPVVNGIQLERVTVGDNVFYGEPASLLEGRETACTRCVGSHGLCTIGEGNCYAPEGCYMCGGCGPDKARCQNPRGSTCECY